MDRMVKLVIGSFVQGYIADYLTPGAQVDLNTARVIGEAVEKALNHLKEGALGDEMGNIHWN